MTHQPRALTIEALQEDQPGDRTGALFVARWPAYRLWMARAEPREPADCTAALRDAMPELMPTFERLLEAVGGGEEEARFLSLYSPPRLTRGCAQVVLDTSDGPALLRTYDHAPHLFDGIVLRSHWGHRATLAVTDCLWGALDGINDSGLAVALAFGGRNAAGPGFAAPLIVRYLLETCATTPDAIAALRRLTIHMPYTFVVLDAAGGHTTAFLSPDRPVEFRDDRASTNHRHPADWPEYERFSASVQRLKCLTALLGRGALFEEHLQACLRPPLWRTHYASGSGTLYAADYRPRQRSLSLHWPHRSERFALSGLKDRSFTITLPLPDDFSGA